MLQEIKTNQDRTFLTLEYDQQNNWIYTNWIGYISPENVYKGITAYIGLLNETQCPYWLNDNRQLVGPWDKANEQLEKVFIPQVIEQGLKFMAHVLSPGIAGALSAQDLHRRTNNCFFMQIFGDLEKAKTWLKSCQDAENN